MIEVVYNRKKLILTVKGHAQSGEAGHDLVCSAASILAYTLAGNVAQMSANKKQVRRPVIELDSGDAKISCSPVHGMQSVVTLVFDSVCAGFDILAQQYPQNVHYSVVG